MTTEETAAQIGEFTVAKLDVKPGDVVVVKIPTGSFMEEVQALNKYLADWAQSRGLNLHFLVVLADTDIAATVHTMTPEELEKAGAGGWPHEGQT
jgi:hypothetical protein